MVRGHLVQIASSRKCSREKKARELSSLLAAVDAAWKAHPTMVNGKACGDLATKLDLLTIAQAGKGRINLVLC